MWHGDCPFHAVKILRILSAQYSFTAEWTASPLVGIRSQIKCVELQIYDILSLYTVEDEDEEDDGKKVNYDTALMPESVISLNATDEFLKNRIMNLPEEVIQVTNVTLLCIKKLALPEGSLFRPNKLRQKATFFQTLIANFNSSFLICLMNVRFFFI